MCSLMKYVYFKVEFSKKRETRTLIPEGWTIESFLGWTVYQIRSSINAPLLKKAGCKSSFKKLKISRVVSVLLLQNKNKESLQLEAETMARNHGTSGCCSNNSYLGK